MVQISNNECGIEEGSKDGVTWKITCDNKFISNISTVAITTRYWCITAIAVRRIYEYWFISAIKYAINIHQPHQINLPCLKVFWICEDEFLIFKTISLVGQQEHHVIVKDSQRDPTGRWTPRLLEVSREKRRIRRCVLREASRRVGPLMMCRDTRGVLFLLCPDQYDHQPNSGLLSGEHSPPPPRMDGLEGRIWHSSQRKRT